MDEPRQKCEGDPYRGQPLIEAQFSRDTQRALCFAFVDHAGISQQPRQTAFSYDVCLMRNANMI